MTFWTDDRNHIVDELLAALWMAAVAPPSGCRRSSSRWCCSCSLIESLSHANLRWSFGPLKHLLVSPQFHRVHHGISIGHEGRTQG